jgi:hypothetical protein
MSLNPVERRLLYLCEHWQAFTSDASKRLLIWHIQDNAVRIVQAFFEVQKHQTEFTTGDLFIVFDTPFENSIQYSRALKQALAGQYQASHDSLKAEGITPDWVFDPATPPHSAAGFIEGLRSFGSRHHESIGHLVAVLSPLQIRPEAHDAFSGWLTRALAAGLPERLRLAVVDSVEFPRLGKLAATQHPQVAIDAPGIDALQTAQETFAQEAGVGPAAVFRNHLMGLTTLVERGSVDQVKAKAMDATAFARKQGWTDQEVVIAVMLFGALAKEKRFDEALAVNAQAREMAQKIEAQGHPAGKQLLLQTWFGEAGIHFSAGDLLKAAAAYKQAGILAQSVPNVVLAIEALRMEAFSWARAGQADAALNAGQDALAVGSNLQPDSRMMTSLPIAALDRLRVLDERSVSRMEDIKSRANAREHEAYLALEQQAAELENVRQPEPFDAAEARYDRQLEAAWQKGDDDLQAVADRAERRFAEAYANGRQLLGPEWPLATLLPAAPLPAVPTPA